jgi:DHA1 family bicyclomycin/chloramphenicol resistance-like MFS transporter
MISSLVMSGAIAYAFASPYLFQQGLNLSVEKFGLLAIYIAASVSLGTLVSNRLLLILSPERILQCGLFIITISGMLMLYFALNGVFTIAVVLGPALLYTFGTGLVYSNAVAIALENCGDISGVAASLFGTVQILISSLVNFVLSSFSQGSLVESS